MGLLRSATVVSASTLVSRVLGMVRDIGFAALLGAGFTMDAFAVAWRVPNLFRRLLGEGALSSAFIPIFSGERERAGKAAAFRFFQNVLTFLTFVLAGITVAGVLAAHLLPATLFGAGETADKAALVLSLLQILFPYVLLINVMSLFMAVLNSLDHFLTPAIAPALLNVFWIGGIYLAPRLSEVPADQVRTVATAIVTGSFVQLLVQIPILRKKGVPLTPRIDMKSPPFRRMLILMIPMVFGLAPVQVNIIIDTVIAEAFIEGHGANSFLFYGNRLVQFPLALIGIALAIVVFPVFSRLAKRGRKAELGRTLKSAMGIAMFLAVPSAAGLITIPGPLIALIFERGEFTAAHSTATAEVLTMYAAGIPAYCGLQIMTRLYYAMEEVRTPVFVGAAMVFVNFSLNLLLVGPLKWGGLALATALSAVLNLAILVVIARKKLGVRGLREVFHSVLRCTLLAAAMAGAVYGLAALLSPAGTPSLLDRIVWVLPPIVAGGALYLGGAWVLRFPEIRGLADRRVNATER